MRVVVPGERERSVRTELARVVFAPFLGVARVGTAPAPIPGTLKPAGMHWAPQTPAFAFSHTSPGLGKKSALSIFPGLSRARAYRGSSSCDVCLAPYSLIGTNSIMNVPKTGSPGSREIEPLK